MTLIENQEISGKSFILEDTAFFNCKLRNCHLFYSGGDFEWTNTTFVGCGFHFRGAAKNSQALFQLLGITKGQLQAPPPMSQKVQ